MPCPFCGNTATTPTTYPTNVFNHKAFEYVRCIRCKLAYLNRFPDQQDYEAMYPPSYQGNTVETYLQQDPYIKLPGLRFSYGYQFDLIKKYAGDSRRILDYGCGTGHFIANAINQGFICDGSEFNPEYLKLLKDNFATSNFYTIDDVLSDNFHEKYDVIRLSNVLEHLTEPGKVISKLMKHLTPSGVILVEGPIEENFCLATDFRKLYFRMSKTFRPNRTVSDPPYHIFLSNRKNQQQFFKDCSLSELHYKTSEDPWPFPESIKEGKGVQGKITALVAKTSGVFTKAFGKKWGNIFIYCGKPLNQ